MWSTNHRWIDHFEVRDEVRTDTALYSLAQSMLTWRSERADRATITTDFIPDLLRGQLVRTSGATDGKFSVPSCLNARWLVNGFVHTWNIQDGPMGARTTLKCEWVGY